MIRTKHSSAKFVYKPHPGELEDEYALLDLDEFEIISNVSSEQLLMRDQSISTVYGFNSQAVYTAAGMGVEAFFLFPLFGEECMSDTVRRQYEFMWPGSVYPEMCVRSTDDLASANYGYDPIDSVERVRESAISMLEMLNIVTPSQNASLLPSLTVTSNEFWLEKPQVKTILGFTVVIFKTLFGVCWLSLKGIIKKGIRLILRHRI